MQTFAYVALFAGGYVASIYTWPEIRTFMAGAEAEIIKLRDRAREIEAKIKERL